MHVLDIKRPVGKWTLFSVMNNIDTWWLVNTVPPETMEPFAAILPRSNCGFDLQFHLGKTASDRIKNLGFTAVKGRTRLGLNRLLFALF